MLIFLTILGVIVGSFINVFVLRRATGKGVNGRSVCASCGKQLANRDLIPVVSYFLLGGKCRFCKTKISPAYSLVELTSGLIFLLIGLKGIALVDSFGTFLLLIIQLVFWSLVLATAVYDLKHKIIPNMWSLALAVIAVLYSLFLNFGEWKAFSYSILSGVIFFAFFFIIWAISQGKWMGLGDAKLAFSLGVFVGIDKLFSAWALSFWTGAIIVLLYYSFETILLKRGKSPNRIAKPITMKSEVPFGPFLALGSLLAFIGIVIPFNVF